MGLCMVFSVCVLAGGAAAIELPAELLLPGEFHGEDISAKSGSEWIVVVRTKIGFELRKETIAVETVFDPINDMDESEPTGKSVKVQGLRDQESAAFLLRHVEGLSDGPVFGAFDGYMWLTPGRPVELGGRRYTDDKRSVLAAVLWATGSLVDPYGNCCKSKDYLLEVTIPARNSTERLDEERQVLVSVADGTWEESTNDAMPTLLWAGDLDRDGVLDFLFDLPTSYVDSSLTLYLSSAAQAGAILGRVAVFRTSGC